MNAHSRPVLTYFQPAQLAKPVSQRITLEVFVHGFAKGYCQKHGIEDKETARQVLKDTREKFSKYALSPDQVRQRQLVFFPRLRDIRIHDGDLTLAEPDPERQHLQLFQSMDDTKGMDLKTRHESFRRIVGDCVNGLYQDCELPPDDLIHVTCSGYLAPSPVERLVSEKEWFDTTVTHSYHMGCYGAFPAIRMAHGFLSSAAFDATPPKHRVDIFHSELLSAHFTREELSVENIITSTLFADGFMKYSVCTESYAREQGLGGLRIIGFNEHLLPDSLDDMTITPTSHHFEITLSVMVPVVLKQHVRKFVVSLLRRCDIDFEKEKASLMFAIHPGGPKIVEHVQSELGLTDDQVLMSKGVLYDNGNMSSVTVPFILKRFLEEKAVRSGQRIVAIGFGPGLTATGLVMEKL